MQLPVPPGHGKPQTRNRNARRRLARQYQKSVQDRGANVSTTGIDFNQEPSVQVSSSQFNEGTTTFTTPELPIPKDMSNKNKKRGFLREMAGLRGKKTVFHADTDGASASLPDTATEVDQSPSSAFSLGGSGNHLQSQQNLSQGDWTLDGIFYGDAVDGDGHRHLSFSTSTPLRPLRNIPPSELTSLPDNIFITRTEFGDSWYGKSNLGRSSNGHRNNEESPVNQQWGVAEEEAEFAGEHGPESEAHDDGTETMAMDKVFWESTEKKYDDLKFLDEDNLSQLRFGSILARKVRIQRILQGKSDIQLIVCCRSLCWTCILILLNCN